MEERKEVKFVIFWLETRRERLGNFEPNEKKKKKRKNAIAEKEG